MQCPMCLMHFNRKEFSRPGRQGRTRWAKVCRVCELEKQLEKVKAEREREREETLALVRECRRRICPDDD